MNAVHGQRSAILYQSVDREITLIDIPTSIATAQGRCDTLLSTSPLEEPIQPKELYQAKESKKSIINQTYSTHHAEYRRLIQQALLDIHAHVSGSWCTPRQILTELPKHGKDKMEVEDPERNLEKRFREWATYKDGNLNVVSFDFQTMMASLGAPEVQPATDNDSAQRWKMAYSSTSDGSILQKATTIEWTCAFHNQHNHHLNVRLMQDVAQKDQVSQEYHFTLPPKCTFFLNDCDRPDNFRSSFRKITDESNLPRHFNLILLDPPWPNRSAKRKGAYEQIGGMPYLRRMLLKMDLDNYFEHNALVGIWITNKSALRDHILSPGGLFETWNVGLIEEWIWVKTTSKGEPIFDIDDAMRKPYEVLLLGRAAPNAWTTMTHAPVPKKKVIAAVPDVHSRKPCLKELLEPYMPDPTDYSALEIFSRSLVSGWTSWGNEVLKYNSDIYWTKSLNEIQKPMSGLTLRVR